MYIIVTIKKFMSNTQDRIIIFDTTLRDGEQSPGATLNVDEKITIARFDYDAGSLCCRLCS